MLRIASVLSLVVCLASTVGVPSMASAAPRLGAEAVGCGGGGAVNATCRVFSTVGLNAVGASQLQDGTTVVSGFWLVPPCAGVPVDGAAFATLTETGTVLVRWTVGSLGEIAGFNVCRSTSEEGPFVRLNEEILAPETPGSFDDATVWPGTTFWYEVRAVLLGGDEDVVAGSPFSVLTPGSLEASLLPPRPNPFRDESTIHFEVPHGTGRVRLAVYSVNGRLVKELVDRGHEGGRYAVRWDGRDEHGLRMSPGVYFVRLDVGSRSETQKLIHVR